RRFVDEFVPGASGQRALVFCGPPGTGKTHLLSAMLRELAARKGVRGRFEEFFLLLSDIRDGFSRGLSSREWLEPLRQVDVLAIDEIGKGGKNRDFEQGILDEILSVRYNAGRPTLLATNYPRPGTVGWEFKADGQSAENLEQRVGPRIYSRLHEMCDLMDVLGDDQREVQPDARQARDSAADAPARGTRPARSGAGETAPAGAGRHRARALAGGARAPPHRRGVARGPELAFGGGRGAVRAARSVGGAPARLDPLAPPRRRGRPGGGSGGRAALPDRGDHLGDAAGALAETGMTRFGLRRRGEKLCGILRRALEEHGMARRLPPRVSPEVWES